MNMLVIKGGYKLKDNLIQTFTIGPLNVHVFPSKTYKTNTILLHIRSPLERETLTKRAILPFVLQRGTEKFPTRQAIRTYLDDLYGATLSADVSKKGENHLMTLRMEIANENFLSDSSPLLEKGLELFSSVLLSPKLESGAFPKETVEGEKRTLKQKISSVYDDKMRYANKRLTEEMCQGEPFQLYVLGKEEDIPVIDEKNLYQYYEQVLNKDQFDMYIVGDVKLAEMKVLIEKHFQAFAQLPDRERGGKSQAKASSKAREVREIIEEQDVQQGKLHIGYRTNITYGDDDYIALQIFNGIFGGFSHSKLFINVREKASLAYYAASRIESHKGLMIVMSGIESNKFADTTKIIFEQMEAMKAGDFTADDISQTKAVYKNQLLETMDVPRGRMELEYHNTLTAKKRPLSEWLEEIEQIRKEDIVSVAKKIQVDTVYFLKGKEAPANE